MTSAPPALRRAARAALLPTLLAGAPWLTACSVGEGIHGFGVRSSVSIADSYETRLSGLGYSGYEESDFQSFDVAAVWRVEGLHKRRIGTGEFSVAYQDLGETEAFELAAGGRWYPFDVPLLRPFTSLGVTANVFDDVPAFSASPGTQLGARAGLGVELPLGEHLYLDLGADYTYPLAAADDIGGLDVRMKGLAVRFGIGWDF